MTEDILHRMRTITANPEMLLTLEMYNESLILIEDMCLAMVNKALVQLGMPSPDRAVNEMTNRDLIREQQYNRNDLTNFVNTNHPKLNQQQKNAFDTIMSYECRT